MSFARTSRGLLLFFGSVMAACGMRAPETVSDGHGTNAAGQSWTTLPAVESSGFLLALAVDGEGRPVLAVRQQNGRHYSYPVRTGTMDAPGTSVSVLRFDGTGWLPLGAALEGAPDEVQGWGARLLVDDGGALIVAWQEADGPTGEVSTVHARRWDGASWQPLQSVAAVSGASDAAVLEDARIDGSILSVLWYDWRAGLRNSGSGFALTQWNGATWQTQPVAVASGVFDPVPEKASVGFAPSGTPVFASGPMFLSSTVASAPDGALLRVSNDPSGTTAALESWTGAWTSVATISGTEVLPPAGRLLAPALAVGGAGQSVVSWLAGPENEIYGGTYTVVVGGWSAHGFDLLGAFPTRSALTIADKALLAFDHLDNLYVTVLEADGSTYPRIVLHRYGR